MIEVRKTQMCEHCGRRVRKFKILEDSPDIWVSCIPCCIKRGYLSDAGDDS